MATHTRLKMCVVVAAVCWSLLLIYLLSFLRGQPGQSPAQSSLHYDALSLAKNVSFSHIAKSQMLMGKFLQQDWQGNGSSSKPTVKLKYRDAAKPLTGDDGGGGEEAVGVVVSGKGSCLLGVVALMNSVTSNTRHPVHFHVTLPGAIIPHFKKWVSKTRLYSVPLTVRPHPVQVPAGRPHNAKIFITDIFPHLNGHFVYLDPDVIVQGDIKELVNTLISGHKFAAFTRDCKSTSTSKHGSSSPLYYSSQLNLQHPAIRALRIHPSECVPNTGVFVTEARLWANASQFMQHLITNTTKNNPIHSGTTDEGEAALLAAVYGHTAPLPQAWHLPDLGARIQVSYSTHFVRSAKLLHWNGRFKPWSRKAAFSDLWLRYYLPDPTGKYRPAIKSLA